MLHLLDTPSCRKFVLTKTTVRSKPRAPEGIQLCVYASLAMSREYLEQRRGVAVQKYGITRRLAFFVLLAAKDACLAAEEHQTRARRVEFSQPQRFRMPPLSFTPSGSATLCVALQFGSLLEKWSLNEIAASQDVMLETDASTLFRMFRKESANILSDRRRWHQAHWHA